MEIVRTARVEGERKTLSNAAVGMSVRSDGSRAWRCTVRLFNLLLVVILLSTSMGTVAHARVTTVSTEVCFVDSVKRVECSFDGQSGRYNLSVGGRLVSFGYGTVNRTARRLVLEKRD